jgi:hypothetical protein
MFLEACVLYYWNECFIIPLLKEMLAQIFTSAISTFFNVRCSICISSFHFVVFPSRGMFMPVISAFFLVLFRIEVSGLLLRIRFVVGGTRFTVEFILCIFQEGSWIFVMWKVTTHRHNPHNSDLNFVSIFGVFLLPLTFAGIRSCAIFFIVIIIIRAMIAHSVYRWATGWTFGVLGFDSRRGLGIFLFTTRSRTALGPTQPPIQWVPGSLSMGVKRPRHEADHSPPSSAEVREWVELYIHSRNTPSWRGA